MDVYNFRSSVLCKNACVVCEHPLSSKIGYDILQKGGNAADAAIAMAAAVGFLSPFACGLGGDCFILYYQASDNSVKSINGSGRSAKTLTLEKVEEVGFSPKNFKNNFDLDETIKVSNHGSFVNVPGFVAGIYQLYEKFGSKKLSMEDLWNPTIKLAENGAPIPKKAAMKIQYSLYRIKNVKNVKDVFENENPVQGTVIRNPILAKCLKEIVTEGPQSFYCGKTAENIVRCVQEAGGFLTMDDMKHHYNTKDDMDIREITIYKDFRGFRIWEMPPNTTGIVVLQTLSLLETIDLGALGHNTAEYIQVVTNALRESFLLCWEYICDPKYENDDFYKKFLNNREFKGITKIAECDTTRKVSPKQCDDFSGDTSYVTVVDEEGNACSLIFSIYTSFGSANIPDDCGFFLHDRAKLFSFDENSSNVFGSRKRSFHTILPAMVTDISTGELLASFGLIGGFMQPQGHIQILLNMIIFGMDPQMALDQPRFAIGTLHLQSTFKDSLDLLNLEAGIDSSARKKLRELGHNINEVSGVNRIIFGCGQVIAKPKLWSQRLDTKCESILWAGSDSRADGIPIGY